MEPTKLVELYLEAYFLLSGKRVAKLEELPEATYLFFNDMQPCFLAEPVILHYKRRGWSNRRVAAHVGVTESKVKVVAKLHGLIKNT